jgi:hypothetical protein
MFRDFKRAVAFFASEESSIKETHSWKKYRALFSNSFCGSAGHKHREMTTPSCETGHQARLSLTLYGLVCMRFITNLLTRLLSTGILTLDLATSFAYGGVAVATLEDFAAGLPAAEMGASAGFHPPEPAILVDQSAALLRGCRKRLNSSIEAIRITPADH